MQCLIDRQPDEGPGAGSAADKLDGIWKDGLDQQGRNTGT